MTFDFILLFQCFEVFSEMSQVANYLNYLKINNLLTHTVEAGQANWTYILGTGMNNSKWKEYFVTITHTILAMSLQLNG